MTTRNNSWVLELLYILMWITKCHSTDLHYAPTLCLRSLTHNPSGIKDLAPVQLTHSRYSCGVNPNHIPRLDSTERWLSSVSPSSPPWPWLLKRPLCGLSVLIKTSKSSGTGCSHRADLHLELCPPTGCGTRMRIAASKSRTSIDDGMISSSGSRCRAGIRTGTRASGMEICATGTAATAITTTTTEWTETGTRVSVSSGSSRTGTVTGMRAMTTIHDMSSDTKCVTLVPETLRLTRSVAMDTTSVASTACWSQMAPAEWLTIPPTLATVSMRTCARRDGPGTIKRIIITPCNHNQMNNKS